MVKRIEGEVFEFRHGGMQSSRRPLGKLARLMANPRAIFFLIPLRPFIAAP